MYIDFYVFFVSIFFIALGIYSLVFLGFNSPESLIVIISTVILAFLTIFSLIRILKKYHQKGR